MFKLKDSVKEKKKLPKIINLSLNENKIKLLKINSRKYLNNSVEKEKLKIAHKPFSGNPSMKFFIRKKKFKKQNRSITTANPLMISAKFINDPFKQHQNGFLFSSSIKVRAKTKEKEIANFINHKHAESFAGILKFNEQDNKQENFRKVPRIIIKKNNKKNPTFIDFSYKEETNSEFRKNMEDFHKIIPNFCNDITKSYFAIFDGHNGCSVAEYCQNNLHKFLEKVLFDTKFNYEKSLCKAFTLVDQNINKISDKKDVGTTATIAVICQEFNSKLKAFSKILYCANVGDSKGFLIRKSSSSYSSIQITTDHKCDNATEVSRIRETGGIVFGGRVFGTLMLTRSIGDKEMSNYGVYAIPSIRRVELSEEDAYVVLASDGIWDIVSTETLDDLFNKYSFGRTTKEINDIIVRYAIEQGTHDNISCIIIKLA